MAERIIFHIDVNSAFLSWTAAYRVKVMGEEFDLRNVPSVIAPEGATRHSIILAKSAPAKKFGIQTGEPLGMAKDKCPNLVVAEPDYELYVTASQKLMALLREYSPLVEQFSIDEAWMDMTGTRSLYGPPVLAAERIKDRIRRELGFTVNIGISSNKLLAKMAGDFEKPDKVHTLFPNEIEQKLFPLPVRELFMIGRATERKLALMGIRTVGQLAQTDPVFLRQKFGKQGELIWNHANGRGSSEVLAEPPANKGYGNSFTTPCDVVNMRMGREVLLSLCETVGMRLRRDGQSGTCVTVHVRNGEFRNWSSQRQLPSPTNVTQEIFEYACGILRQMWDGREPLRQLGVQVTQLCEGGYRQQNLFDGADFARLEKLDTAVDAIREKFGEHSLIRAAFLTGPIDPMAGGLSKERRTGVTKPIDDLAAKNRGKFGE